MQTSGREQIPVRLDGLQLGERRSFQRAVWAVQRAVWAFFAVVLAVALAGGTGRGGPLAQTTVTTAMAESSVPRVGRRGAVAQIDVSFLQDAPDHRLFLPPDLLDRFEVQTVTPRPVAEMAVDGGVVMFFAASGPAPHDVSLHLRANGAGAGELTLVADGVAARFASVTLP